MPSIDPLEASASTDRQNAKGVSALGYLRRTPLLAWAFAYAYAACDAMLPGSFSAPIE